MIDVVVFNFSLCNAIFDKRGAIFAKATVTVCNRRTAITAGQKTIY